MKKPRVKVSDIRWFYINLDRRGDRRKYITEQLRKVHVEAERFPAMQCTDFKGHPREVENMLTTPKTIGNWLSHTAVWKKVAGTSQIAGVLEDDAILCVDFQDRLKYIEENMTLPWDIIYLGATYHINPPVWYKAEFGRDFELTGIKHIHRVYGAFSNQGYLVNGERAERLLELMESYKPFAKGSDHAMIMLQPQLQCYSFTPGMVFQVDGKSDIGDGITRFSSFLKSLGPYCWTNRLSDFPYDKFNWAEGRVQ